MPEAPSSLTREQGHAGIGIGWTSMFFDATEETAELRWPHSVQVYDRMRKTDAQVQSTYKAITLPILRLPYFVRPNGARDEVVERLADNLNLPIEGQDASDVDRPRMRGRFQWRDYLRHARLDLIFGHMAFEQVYAVDDDGFLRIKKLAPRMPQTIAEIKVARDGGLEYIEQHNMGADSFRPVRMEIDRLVWHANDREAGAWVGQSILRACYRNWLMRNRFYRVDGLSKERNGMGVPTMKRTIPQRPTPAEVQAAEDFAKRYRAGEFSGGYIPYGFELELKGVQGTLPDALESAKHHGEEIPFSMLAQFLNLGRTETGSRALGSSFIDFFLLAEMAYVEQFLEVVNEHVVEDWVDLNWGEAEKAPLVASEDIADHEALSAEALQGLIQVGAVVADEALRTHLRRTYRLPEESGEAEPVTAKKRRPSRLRAQQGQFRRELFDHELRAQTDFEAIQGQWEDALAKLVDDFGSIRQVQIDELLEQVESLIDSGDVAALGALTVNVDDARAVIEEALLIAADEARDEALAEAARQGLDLSAPPVDRDLVAEHATRVALLMGSDLSSVVGRKAGENVAVAGGEAAQRVRDHLDSLSDSYLTDILGGALTTAQNTGRFAVMDEGGAEELYSSELLDKNTCTNCADLDGKQYDSLGDAQSDYPNGRYFACLGGDRCRGTLVAIYGEAEPSG